VSPKQDRIEYCHLLRTTAKYTYDSIKSVFCPVLNKDVLFNARGFYHLSYKADGTPRDVREIIYKLTLVPLATPVVKNAIGIHEEREIVLPKNRKRGAKKNKSETICHNSNSWKKKSSRSKGYYFRNTK